jgi:hypothetical protein
MITLVFILKGAYVAFATALPESVAPEFGVGVVIGDVHRCANHRRISTVRICKRS